MKNKRWMAAALCFMLAGVGPSSAVAQGAEETVDTQPENTAEETAASQAEESTEEETEEGESSPHESDNVTVEENSPDETNDTKDGVTSSDASDNEDSLPDETDNTEDAESSLDLLKVRSCTAVNNGTEIIVTMVTENTEYDTICLAYNEEVGSAECIPAEQQEDGSFLFCFIPRESIAFL